MALKLTQPEMESMYSKATSLASRARKALEKADVAVEKVVTATVTGGTAFAFGVAQGRYGGVEVLGIPVDLGGGIALHALGFAGVGGKASEYLHAAGNGALASYLTTLGRGVGNEWAKKAGTAPAAGAPAALPAATSAGETISDEELARMARGSM